ncbi:MAG: leucine-rich repeat domain-containing protein [Clostridia bacterium]|nr:leucine-rich repeat domain-containing protein [Clostridia bacterium]
MKKALIIAVCCILSVTLLLAACGGNDTPIKYKVTFVYGDGETTVQEVEKGKPAIPPSDTAKPDDDEYSYTFVEWDKDFGNITEDITVTAVYAKTPKSMFIVEEVEGGYKIIGARETLSGSIAIPATIGGRAVVAIGDAALINNIGITDIVIPDSVTSIGGGALAGCKGIAAITLPVIGGEDEGHIGYIFGSSAYDGGVKTDCCVDADGNDISPKTYYIPASLKSVTVRTYTVPAGAFYGCSGIEDIELTDCVKFVAAAAFYGCKGLDEIVLPASMRVTYAPEEIYHGNDYEDVIFPLGVDAFAQCDNLVIKAEFSQIAEDEDICNMFAANPLERPVIYNYNSEVTEHGLRYVVRADKAYIVRYEGQDTDVVIPNSLGGARVAEIAMCAFSLTEIDTVTIPSSVEYIGSYVFYVSSLQSVIFERDSQLKEIEDFAFPVCDNLSEIYIPASVERVTSFSFHESDNLSVIEVDEDNLHYCSVDNVLYSKDMSVLHFAPRTLSGRFVVPSQVKSLSFNAFYTCQTLTQVVLPEGLEVIGAWALGNCYDLTDVNLPSTLKIIGFSAFGGAAISTLHIPASVEYIGPEAFDFCKQLEQISVDEHNNHFVVIDGILYTKSLDKIVFVPYNIQGDIVVPQGVESIRGFADRRSFTSITLPSSVTTIEEWAFNGCASLERVVMSNGVTSIGEHAFTDCSGLTDITLPGSIRVIGDSAFVNCIRLPNIALPSNVKSIGSYAFFGCLSLSSIVIPNSVEQMGEFIFGENPMLTVYCVAESKPSGWDENWSKYMRYGNDSYELAESVSVVWGYKA